MATRLTPILLVAVLAMVVTIHSVYACFDPMDLFSGEVVLNKPGITYNLTVLDGIENVTKISDDLYVYRSHVGNFAVIIYLQGYKDGAPVLSGDVDEYYLGVRAEPLSPPSLDEVGDKLREDDEVKENFTKDLKKVFDYELKWLRDLGVVMGLSDGDIASIVSAVEAGSSGWNSRLVYYSGDGAWHEFAELVSKGLINGSLIRSHGCRWVITKDMVPETPPNIPATSTGSTITHGTGEEQATTTSQGIVYDHRGKQATTIPSQGIVYDHIAVAIAIAMGIAVALILVFLLKR